jgi:outer membrane lipoprotein SlyB
MDKADMGDVIKDFQDSDAPQFKGKSKEKRRQMAIAAKMQAKNEEVELDEAKVTHSDKSAPGKGKALKDMSKSEHIDSIEHHEREMMAADKKGQSYNVKHHQMMAKVHRVNAQGGSSMMHKEGVTGAVAGGVLGAAVGGGVGAAAGAYLGHKIQKAANKKKNEDVEEEMTPDQKQKRMDMIRKAASNVAAKKAAADKRAMRDAKRGMRNDPVLGKRPVDEDAIDEATPTRKQVKQGIGIARDKRYAGGNMTGAVKTMDKINKGLAQHPAVAKELKKQNEEVELDEGTGKYTATSEKSKQTGGYRPHLKNAEGKTSYMAGVSYKSHEHAAGEAAAYHKGYFGSGHPSEKGAAQHVQAYRQKNKQHMHEAVGTAAKHAGKTGLMGGKYDSHTHAALSQSKAVKAYVDKRRKDKSDQHAKQDPKHAAAGYAKHMVDTAKAKKNAAARGVSAAHLNWKHTNGVQRGKLPEEVQLHENEVAEMYLRQLHFIDYAADELMEFIEMGGMCEEWVQNKLAKVHGDMETIHAWMEGTKRMNGMSQDEDDMDEELDSNESDVDYDTKPTFAQFMSRLNK